MAMASPDDLPEDDCVLHTVAHCMLYDVMLLLAGRPRA